MPKLLRNKMARPLVINLPQKFGGGAVHLAPRGQEGAEAGPFDAEDLADLGPEVVGAVRGGHLVIVSL